MAIFPAGRKTRWLFLFLLALFLCSAAASAAVHLRAWYHYRAAESALSCYHFAQARASLAIPLRTWPNSWRVHLLAARAARLDGAFEEARRHLFFCQQSQPSTDEILLEWALLRAQVGELAAVEAYLIDQLRRGSSLEVLIQEALIEGYVRTYRIARALGDVEKLLRQHPDDTQALYLRGGIWQQIQQPQIAVDSYRRIVELDPQRDDARWRLSQCLLKLGLYEEANPHLEDLHRLYPQNVEMTIELAGARFKQGQLTESRQLLDDVLAEHPDKEAALRERGRVALTDENAAEAEKWLRQAEKHNPHDALLLPLMATALENQGKHDEAQVFRERLKRNDRDYQRLGQICLHELEERPNDPVLHRELASLLQRLGYPEAACGWLLLALQEDSSSSSARAARVGANHNSSTSGKP